MYELGNIMTMKEKQAEIIEYVIYSSALLLP
jgi:hypothetical protein